MRAPATSTPSAASEGAAAAPRPVRRAVRRRAVGSRGAAAARAQVPVGRRVGGAPRVAHVRARRARRCCSQILRKMLLGGDTGPLTFRRAYCFLFTIYEQ
mgnify:CR=1 FL=1